MAKITEIPRECPQCGGEVWDNTKREKRNPKAPDVACKDKEFCKWAGWLPSAPKAAGGFNRLPQEYPHAQLYKLCVQYAIKEIRPLFADRDLQPEHILSAAATLFIQASKGGDIFKKAAPVPTSAPQPQPEVNTAPPQQNRPATRGTGMDQGHYSPPPVQFTEDDLPF